MEDVLIALLREGHLANRHVKAGHNLLKELRKWHGTSAGMVGQVEERVDMSLTSKLAPPGGGDSLGPLQEVMTRLRPHERELLQFLVVHRELPRGHLADFGRRHSAYTTRAQATAVAVGYVRSMLESLAAYQPAPQPHWSGSRYTGTIMA